MQPTNDELFDLEVTEEVLPDASWETASWGMTGSPTW